MRTSDLFRNREKAWQNSNRIAVVSYWLRECHLDHGIRSIPPPKDLPLLPTRVIDVGPADGSEDPYLCLSAGRYGLYTCLSHCWGKNKPLSMTLENLESLVQRIDLSTLPKTFLDAVEITRGLGIRYLWIDSLCIAQGDKGDWDYESTRMGTIYEKSYLTIAATAAANSEQGCFQEGTVVKLQLACNNTSPDGDHEHNTVGFIGLEASELRNFFKAPLNRRAWTLQEITLAPRVVHFAEDQMYWKCPHGAASEDGSLDRFTISSDRFTDTNDFASRFLWWNIAEDYSRRQLSHEDDRLRALAHITKAFQQRTGYRPVVGLWQEDIHYGLLWSNVHSSPTRPGMPSWSWLSVNGLIQRPPERIRHAEADLKIVGINVSWSDKEINSLLAQASISVRGRVMPTTWDLEQGKPQILPPSVPKTNSGRRFGNHIPFDDETRFRHYSSKQSPKMISGIGSCSFDRGPDTAGKTIHCLLVSKSAAPRSVHDEARFVWSRQDISSGEEYNVLLLDHNYRRIGTGNIHYGSFTKWVQEVAEISGDSVKRIEDRIWSWLQVTLI
ncbi:HET-domain-containing protein [Zopfia rhizophila CBS 207.26]|uniref:HET-domain-containing protein n=1 Tax=Zopfia rhizophila CBS 207.26 TaxID=1314779 RepID=A0A6A6DSI2_9PEZI|nr:HET-domain-containing protein [Zopfia rhizophila CBS 207.26]